jgi:antitoxin HicB
MKLKASAHRYTVFLEPDPAGGFVATVPILPGCTTQGNTIDDALAMAKDAIKSYIAVLKADGDSIPIEHPDRRIADVVF